MNVKNYASEWEYCKDGNQCAGVILATQSKSWWDYFKNMKKLF